MEPEILEQALKGSYYTIVDAGEAVEECLDIYIDTIGGTPDYFVLTTGAKVNAFAATKGKVVEPFRDDLTVLMFPLDGLDLQNLITCMIGNVDSWFDDVIADMVEV